MTGTDPVICWQLVRSTAGRDVQRYYLVLDVGSDGSALLVDGDRRRMENPKRKNLKHLAVMPAVAEGLVAKAGTGGKITNADLRSAIAGLTAPPPTD